MGHHFHATSCLKAFTVTLLILLCVLSVNTAGAATLSLPNSLQTIEEEAFYGDTSLDEVILPEEIKTIGERAFANSSIATIYLPASINSIADDAFQNTSVIGTGLPGTYAHQWFTNHGLVYVTETTPVDDFEWETINGIEAKITKYKGSDKRVFVPALIDDYDIVEVSAKAFYGNSTIESVSIPASVRTIKNEAFRNCSALQTVMLNDGLEVIGNSAFRNCDSLASFTFPSSVIELGSYVLADCDLISSTNYPINAATVGEGTFNNDPLMTSFQIEEGITIIHGRFFDNNKYLVNVQFPSTLQTIGPRTFYGCTGLTTVTLPESTVTIGSYAFYGCTGISSIIIPDTVTAINSHAFEKCSLLGSVVFSQQLVDIGANAFAECTSLTEANLPDSVVGLGEGAFRECTSLTTFRYPASLIRRNSQYDNGYLYDGNIFYNCKNLRTIVIPEGVTIIPSGLFMNANYVRTIELPSTLKEIHKAAFKNCISIRTISIPDGVEEIRAEAFSGCTALTAADLPDSVTGLGEKAFYGCTALTSFHYPLSLDHVVSLYDNNNLYDGEIFRECKKLSTIAVPEGITTIPKYLFRGNNYLTTISLPSTLTLIDSHSFENCTALTSLNLPNGLLNVNAAAFAGCTLLQNADLPDSLVGLGERTFDGCINLQSFHYPRNLIHLNSVYDNGHLYEGNVLRNCEKITSVEIPSGVTKIPDLMFQGCNYLQTVIVPDSVTAISDSKLFWNDGQAFKDCVALEKIYISPNVTSIGDDVFEGCTNLTVWCEYGSTILQYCKDNGVAYYYLTPDGVNSPSGTLYRGDSYGLHGYARASIPLTEVTATIWNSDKSEALQVKSVNPAQTDYSLTDEINYHILFGTLPLGTYHYTLHASTELSEETWADTTFKIVPPPLRIYISNLSLPYGLGDSSTDYSIGGTIVSNYTITQVKVSVYRPDTEEVVKTITATPNSASFSLSTLNDQLSLGSYTNETLSIKILATSNGETRTLKDTDLALRTSANIVLNERKNQTLIDFASDSENRSIFTTVYVDAVIDDMSWVEDGIMLADNILSISIFERIENLLIHGGNRQDLIELYKKEIVQLIEDGAYEQFNIAGTASKYSKDLLSILKSEGKLTKEAFKDFSNTKMENYVGSINKLIGAVKDGLSTAKDLEEAYETIATICGNFETGLYVLDFIGSSANIASRDEFNEALGILRTEYVSAKAAIVYEHLKIIQDLIIEFGEDKIKDALKDLLKTSFGTDFSVALPKMFAKLTMKATGLDDVASTYKKLFVRQDLLNIAIESYKQAFDRVHNGDHSDEALLNLARAISTTKAAWVRANDLITKLPRYAYTVGNEYLDYRYNGRISVLLTSSDYD